MEILRVLHLRIFHVDVPVSAIRELGVGRRMALATRRERRAWSWPRGFRRLLGRAHDGRRDGAGGRAGAWAPPPPASPPARRRAPARPAPAARACPHRAPDRP